MTMTIVLRRPEIAPVLALIPTITPQLANQGEKRIVTKLVMQMQHALVKCEREFVLEDYVIELIAPALERYYGVTFESLLREKAKVNLA